MKQIPAPEIFSLLTQWALRPDASTDLRNIFGGDSDRYQPLLQSIRSGDFSWVPQVQILPAVSMGSADGAYSRETGSIYISSDCPADHKESVLLEEIGHHIDALFNEQETPGDEGSLFSAAVRGITLSEEEITAILNEDDSALLSLYGREIAVECASRVPIPTTSRIPTTPAKRQPVAPVVTVKPGAKGNVAKKEEWVTSDVDYSLNNVTDASTKRGLSLVGGGNLVGIGNAGGTSKQNTLDAASNTGNTTLIAGTASTSMRGGSGDNWFDATQSQGSVTIQGGSGNSTMYAANGPATLVGGGKNNFLVAGTAPTRTLGQSLVGGRSSLHGNTLYGGTGRDTLRSVAGFSTLISGSNPGVSTTIGTAAALGVTSIRVASAAGLAVGQQITGNGIAAGTTIKAIAGTQLTLSAITTAAIVAGTRINTVGNILIGGGSSNSLVANVGNDSLVALSGNSTLLGGTGSTTLLGGAAGSNNWLQSGSTGASGNTLVGGAGSNTLVAGLGRDTIVGGANQNLLLVTQTNRSSISNDSFNLSTLSSARNTLGVSGTSLGDNIFSGMATQGVKNLTRVENVASVAARIEIGANAEAVGVRTLASGATNDTLSAAGYQNASVLLDGSRAASRVSMVGGARNDTLLGSRGGVDTLIGGAGNDSLALQNANISLMSLDGGTGSDTLGINTASLTLQGASFSKIKNIEVLQLGSGNNEVGSLQGSGIQRIVGNSGRDILAANVFGAVKAVTRTSSNTITLNVSPGTSVTMGFDVGQVVTGNGIALGTTITKVSSVAAVGATPGTVTLTLSTPTISLISQGGSILGWINGATLDGGINRTSDSLTTNAQGDYLVGLGKETLLKGATNSGSQLVSNTLVSGAFASNTLTGGAGANFYLINNLPGAAALPTIQNPTTLQSASTIQFTGNGVKLDDAALSSVSARAAQKILTANGNNLISIGINAAEIGIQTIIGGVGSDTFVTGLQLGDPIYMNLTTDALLGDLVIYVNDTSELSIGSLVTGDGIAESTSILGIDLETGAVTLSNGISQDLLTDSLLTVNPLTPYAPSVYFDASRGSGNQSLASGSGNDTLLAGTGNATLSGGDGNNSFRGGAGNNLILSGVGNSTLDGGFGTSTLQADGGVNRFIIRNRNTRILNPYTLERDLLTGEIAPPDPAPIATTPEIAIVDTYVNFDPILGDPVSQFSPYTPDNSPSITKSPSFASSDLSSFYNLQYFNLLGSANYGVGNALDNTISAAAANALILGMGGNNTLLASGAGSSLYGNSNAYYASPDLYAYAPTDTRTQAFVDGVMGVAGNNSLLATGANSYLDGGAGYDDGLFNGSGANTLIGTGGNSTVIVSHQADFVSLTGASNTVITSVDLYQAPDNVSDLILNVTPQLANSGQVSLAGQRITASYAAMGGAKGGYTDINSLTAGNAPEIMVPNSARLQVAYGISDGTIYGSENVTDANLLLTVRDFIPDPKNPGKQAVTLSWTTPLTPDGNPVGQTMGYLVNYQIVAYRIDLNTGGILYDASGKPVLVSETLDSDGNAIPMTDSEGNNLPESATPYLTYLNGASQDLKGTSTNPRLLVDNLSTSFTDPYGNNGQGTIYDSSNSIISYNFKVTAKETVLPAYTDEFGNLIAKPVSLIGGEGNEVIYGGLLDNYDSATSNTRPVLTNNPINSLDINDPGTILTPVPWNPTATYSGLFPTYLSGGLSGDDLLIAPRINDGSGNAFTAYQYINGVSTAVTYSGLNTLEGGQGSDTFVVFNGGRELDTLNGVVQTSAYDDVIKYGSETPVGQHNLIVSLVDNLSLSDTVVNQGKFIDQAWAARGLQYIGGNRLDNSLSGYGVSNTLLGAGGRDLITGSGRLIGGTAYGLDSIAGALADYAANQTASIYRDTDPVPVLPNGPGSADNSQYWMVNGGYDSLRNSDSLIGGGVLDGGAGNDSMVGGTGTDTLYVSSINTFDTLTGTGSSNNTSISLTSAGYGGDVVGGGGGDGNDWIILTGSDVYWSGRAGATTAKLGYALTNSDDAAGGQSISNIKLQDGSPVARRATGNATSTGNQHNPPTNRNLNGLGLEKGSNQLIGNEQDNTLDGGGVGGTDGTGVGVDTLTGGAGADLFIVGSGYTGSNSNRSATYGLASGASWYRVEYRTDAQYAYISDFSSEDRLRLTGNISQYFIGEAPSGFSKYNIGAGASISGESNSFGIYYVGDDPGSTNDIQAEPDLVASIQLASGTLGNLGNIATAGGIPIDGKESTYVNPNHLGGSTGSIFNSSIDIKFLGVGAMYNLQGSDFANHVTFGAA